MDSGATLKESKELNNCPECGGRWVDAGGASETCVGYFSPPDHDHDDNCQVRVYLCANGHRVPISRRRRCPVCGWVGKKNCFCHRFDKVDEWPQIAVE